MILPFSPKASQTPSYLETANAEPPRFPPEGPAPSQPQAHGKTLPLPQPLSPGRSIPWTNPIDAPDPWDGGDAA